MEKELRENSQMVFGKNNVTELLMSETPVDKVFISGDGKNNNFKKIIALCKNKSIPIVSATCFTT